MTARNFAAMQDRADARRLHARVNAALRFWGAMLAVAVVSATLTAAAMVERGWTDFNRMQLEAGE